MAIAGLVPGRIVLYVPSSSAPYAEARPAIVTKVWDRESGMVNLQVFLDGRNDGVIENGEYVSVQHETSVLYSEAGSPRSWHWPQQEG